MATELSTRRGPDLDVLARLEFPIVNYEVARTIMFLASPDADYITGQTLNVSGGLHIGY